MALKATICKATLGVADMDRAYYGTHALTLALHPSETAERMMVRVLAFALHASDRMEFGRGIATDDEPALWERDDTGRILNWIEVGLPDERVLRRAAGRADQVVVYGYGGRAVDLWWQRSAATLAKVRNLVIHAVPPDAVAALGTLAERNMQLHFTRQEGSLWLASETATAALQLIHISGHDD
ncbi:MAG: YaeQ family protein [Casimicrobiaceae bacterium]